MGSTGAVVLTCALLTAAIWIGPPKTFAQTDAAAEPTAYEPRDALEDEELSCPDEAVAVETLREAHELGTACAGRGMHVEALHYFERASEIEERPEVVYNIATTLAVLGRHVEAIREFTRFLEVADPVAFAAARSAAQGLIATLRESVKRVTIRISPHDATLEVDGVVLPLRGSVRTFDLDPGEHVITVRREGYQSQNVNMAGRSDVRVDLVAEPGTLVVTTEMLRGTIHVDGREVGRGEVALDVDPGSHTVTVRVPRHDDFEREVEVAPGARVRVHATFTVLPPRRNPIFWAVVGVVVTGAVVGTTLALTIEKPIIHGDPAIQALRF